MTPLLWKCRDHRFEIGSRSLVMGIVNVTPDSFSDGGQFFDPARAIDHGLQLVAEGADILDIGGESTRPGSDVIPAEEEWRRVQPVVAGLAKHTPVPLSIDTMKAAVAERCLDAGAAIINDVSGFTADADMVSLAAKSGAGLVVMHMLGTPQTMQQNPQYEDVVREVGDYLESRMATLLKAGVAPEAIAVDPGIGFGKTQEHNLALLANLAAFRRWNRPICLGVSRKGMLGLITGRPRSDRLASTLAVNCFALRANAAQILRVHDVAPTRDAVLLHAAIFPDSPRNPSVSSP